MDTFDRLYEALILDKGDRLTLAELLALLKSNDPETRWAARDVLKDFELEPGVRKWSALAAH